KNPCAPAVESVKLSAGVVPAFATEVVKSGARFPAENEVTVPPAPAPHALPESASAPLAPHCTQSPLTGEPLKPVTWRTCELTLDQGTLAAPSWMGEIIMM